MHLDDRFTAFVTEAEPRLRRALVAHYGMEDGREATLDALVYCWRNWQRVSVMANPVGYLYRVGTSSIRTPRPTPAVQATVVDHEPWVEPELEAALDTLTEQQRVIAVLRHSFEWTYEEIAGLLDVSVRAVRTQLDRAMLKLRETLEVTVDE